MLQCRAADLEAAPETIFMQKSGRTRASLVVIAATLTTFNIPEAGLLLIMGIDQFLDMGRSATNAVGNSIAAAVVAKWEGELEPEAEDKPAIQSLAAEA
jgi:Na+/H+-dicarboxylate symporter